MSAPGRVNLIGEHTDYNEGFVMPFCLEQKTVIVGRITNGSVCRVVSANADNGKVTRFPGNKQLQPMKKHWSNYMRGVVKQYLADCGGIIGFDAAVYSSVPLGGGVSSSASLEVATAQFIESLFNLTPNPTERALRCQKAEHEFAGVPCGIMDQFISSCGTKGNVLKIDCRTYEPTAVPLNDPSVSLVVCNSNVKHELVGTEYPERVQHCKDAVTQLKQTYKDRQISELRDCTMKMLDSVKSELTETVYNRAKHGITEDVRTLAAEQALLRRDYDTVGRLMVESHNSLSELYEVSCNELDILVEIACDVPGVYGSRMTGGGFGGCTVTLVQTNAVPKLMKTLKARYKDRTNLEADVFATQPQGGAKIIEQGVSVQAQSDSGLVGIAKCVLGVGLVVGLGYLGYKLYQRKKGDS